MTGMRQPSAPFRSRCRQTLVEGSTTDIPSAALLYRGGRRSEQYRLAALQRLARSATPVVATMLFFWTIAATGEANAAVPLPIAQQSSITDRSVSIPQLSELLRVLLLKDYNTRVVIIGATLLGGAGGLVGSFTLLRKRALMGDALSHATLPGIAIAFMAATYAGINGKSLPILLAGATATGLVGVGAILVIGRLTRLKEDTALGAVLSVFFGAGVALLGVVQQMQQGHAAGLEAFIYGKTASMGAGDAWLIAAAAIWSIAVSLMLFKELKLLCFDEGFAGSRGYPTILLDLTLMALVVIVTIVGLQAVGLILMIAVLVIPAAAARFWTERMSAMMLISAVLGALSAMVGAAMSALFANLPSGAMIVLVCTAFFCLSLVLGRQRGLLVRWLRRERLNRSIDRQHLLRAMYELLEPARGVEPGTARPRSSASIDDLLSKRSWSQSRVLREIRRTERAGLIRQRDGAVEFTDSGWHEARRLTHQHRLWELYLITYADVAPSRVDRDADAIEHVLEPDVVAELQRLLQAQSGSVPATPHALKPPAAAEELR